MRAYDVLGPGSPLSKLLSGYEDRPGQLAMAEAVEGALMGDRPLLVEAGTGTGKTLAYLIPAILSGRKVVISTATRALQEQIMTKDLPLAREILAPLGVTFRAALMKGLPNYLCKRRLAELLGTTGGRVATDRVLSRIEQWAKETETGDRAELVDVPEDAEGWREVQSGSETRIGAECKYYQECFITRMRRDAEDAELLIVNHHLFFADLALRRSRSGDYASAIPNYDAVIFDEAHQLEDVATDFFGVRVSSGRIEALTRDAKRSLMATGLLDALGKGSARPLLELADEAARAFFAALGDTRRGQGVEAKRVLGAGDWTPGALKAFGKLDACLEALAAYATSHDADEAIALIARRARELRSDLREIVDGARASSGAADARRDDVFPVDDDEPSAAPSDADPDARVAWLDVRERTVSIGASPVDLGPTLRKALFDRVPGIICTSATLATVISGAPRAGGEEGAPARGIPSFHFAKARLGAPPGSAELVVPSPFDFATRAALYVSRTMPDPSDPAFEAAAVGRIQELVEITGGGAFVLCTSTRAMKAIHRALAPRLRLPLLVQGEAPKHLLLSRFRAAGDAVLVATMSFWEGVDVPGRALRLVILDKIPFFVPTDPIVQARCAQIEREGGNPFSQYSVPAAAITLKQGFGRLLRSQKDAGIVAILDPRIVTRGYGKALLASLPPARVVRDLDTLRAFWAELSRSDDWSQQSPVGADGGV